jgi:glyoxylase-like metal-dependent hydrolase (beta-lactamase superfamily II)
MVAVPIIDLEYLGTPGSIAAYLVEGPAGPVLVETGPGNTTAALERGLRRLGVAPGDVRDVLVTHIHFDHAGAAGWMARHGARIHVHSFGAPHLVDPSRLVASAQRIYGDRMAHLWGELIPIPAAQVAPIADGDVVRAGGLEFRAIETPGHARHHHAFAVEVDGERVCFTGDAAATFVAEAPSFVSLPTPPPEFDLEQWRTSLDRLARARFDALYPTHFGRVDDAAAHLARVRDALEAHAAYVRAMMDEGVAEEEMRRRYAAWFARAAEAASLPRGKMGFYVKDTMAGMNVTGIVRYWTKRATAR